ncbi:MAG: hypothetical protein HZY75_13465 [Nocardioidaceae bacterium]|nr:MAG: hypothetical protein HZY75_13465 [Nocardioidaceae bacterium]
MNEQTYTNSKGQTKPLYAIETRTGNPQPYRVMKRGVEVAAYRHKG